MVQLNMKGTIKAMWGESQGRVQNIQLAEKIEKRWRCFSQPDIFISCLISRSKRCWS